MSINDIITAYSDPEFYSRVGFLAMRTAQNVASEDPATTYHVERVNYANRIFSGGESKILLSEHVASSNATISATLETQGGAAVPDGDIEFALAGIWDARSLSYAQAHHPTPDPAPLMASTPAAAPPPEPPLDETPPTPTGE